MKKILITGASRGIGAAIAMRYSAPNTHLVLLARDCEHLHDVQSACEALGARIDTYSVDLSSPSSRMQLMQNILQGEKFDVVIHNAGLWYEDNIMTADHTRWAMMMEVNLIAVMDMTQKILPFMSAESMMFFMNSTASVKMYAGGTNYCAAKFGLRGFAGSLFEDVRERGIRVCSVQPGFVNTDMHANDVHLDASKMIQPSSIAETIYQLEHLPRDVCPTEITLLPQFNPKC